MGQRLAALVVLLKQKDAGRVDDPAPESQCGVSHRFGAEEPFEPVDIFMHTLFM
jgi:hypothetical protein